MLEFSKRSNTLEQSAYKYSLQDVEEPNYTGTFSHMILYPGSCLIIGCTHACT